MELRFSLCKKTPSMTNFRFFNDSSGHRAGGRCSRPHHSETCTGQTVFSPWDHYLSHPLSFPPSEAHPPKDEAESGDRRGRSSDSISPDQLSCIRATLGFRVGVKKNNQPLPCAHRPSSHCISVMLNKDPLLIQWHSLLILPNFLSATFQMGTGYVCFTQPRNQLIAQTKN